MKKCLFTAIVSLAVLLTACDSTDDFSISRGAYIAGYFGYGLGTRACYWINGRRVALNGYYADSIKVSNGRLLITGFFRASTPITDMEEFFGSTAFINGETYPLYNCYWINGKRYDTYYVQEENEPRIDRETSAYWVNGERIKIDDFRPSAITVSGGTVYVAGERREYITEDLGNGSSIYYMKRIYTYYANGQFYDLQDIQEEFQKLRDNGIWFIDYDAITKIQVYDGRVYIFGTYPFNGYWVDCERVTLDFPEGTFVRDYAISGGKFYMVGFYGYYQQSEDQPYACYWVDGERYDLNGSSAMAIFVAE